MRIVFRADASQLIGTGHVMRCLTLAKVLTDHGAFCYFICRKFEGDLIGYIRSEGFEVRILPEIRRNGPGVDGTLHADFLGCSQAEDATQCVSILSNEVNDWLIVDHYGLDARWELALKQSYKHLMVVDDLADRSHACDLLLDQTFGRNKQDYAAYVPQNCRLLCGSEYALLRPEFAEARSASLARRNQQHGLRRLLITMGGVDKDNVTGQVLTSLRQTKLPLDCQITVVMGLRAPWLHVVEKLVGDMPWQTEILVNVANMAELMAESDLAIGAAGATSWERCCLGLPSMIVVLADNQRVIADQLNRVGAVEILFLSDKGDSSPLFDASKFTTGYLMQMSQQASAISDGLGARKVADNLMKFL